MISYFEKIQFAGISVSGLVGRPTAVYSMSLKGVRGARALAKKGNLLQMDLLTGRSCRSRREAFLLITPVTMDFIAEAHGIR